MKTDMGNPVQMCNQWLDDRRVSYETGRNQLFQRFDFSQKKWRPNGRHSLISKSE